MSKFQVTRLEIPDVCVLKPTVYEDHRGYFMESYNRRDFNEEGFMEKFVQDNESLSTKGVIRGLHYQYKYPQNKLVRVLVGRIYDVAVDLRVDSPTFKHYVGIELSDKNKKQLYIPAGFAHGFLVLSEKAQVLYKTTSYYHQEYECGIRHDDPDIHIDWPIEAGERKLSDKDRHLPYLRDVEKGRLFIL